MNNKTCLPWALIFIGVFIAVVVELLRIPVLPVAIGLYLPPELSWTIRIQDIAALIECE